MTLDDNPILCGDYDYETGVNYMREYVHSGSKLPDVFVCANDNIAAGICAEAEQWGYRVPDDFLVTGFDNLDKAAYFRPQITTVFQDREEIGKLCVDVLLRIWEGKPVEERNYIPVTCIFFPFTLFRPTEPKRNPVSPLLLQKNKSARQTIL